MEGQKGQFQLTGWGGVNLINGTIGGTPYGSGIFKGMFFGAGANAAKEIGGVWNLNNGTATATGVLGAKQ